MYRDYLHQGIQMSLECIVLYHHDRTQSLHNYKGPEHNTHHLKKNWYEYVYHYYDYRN